MTAMTGFPATAERVGKTASERRAAEAMANALGSVENAIADGDTRHEGHCLIDDAGQYASEGLDSLGKRALDRIPDERVNGLVREAAPTFDYLEGYSGPVASPEANNGGGNAVTTARASVFIPSPATSMPFGDFTDGMYLFAGKWAGEIAVDRAAIRVESLYSGIAFRTMAFGYLQAVLSRDDRKKRMFRPMATGGIAYAADDWDNGIYSPRAKAYGDVPYGMPVRLPENAENERKSLGRPCK